MRRCACLNESSLSGVLCVEAIDLYVHMKCQAEVGRGMGCRQRAHRVLHKDEVFVGVETAKSQAPLPLRRACSVCRSGMAVVASWSSGDKAFDHMSCLAVSSNL